jgi:hypothetical protein
VKNTIVVIALITASTAQAGGFLRDYARETRPSIDFARPSIDFGSPLSVPPTLDFSPSLSVDTIRELDAAQRSVDEALTRAAPAEKKDNRLLTESRICQTAQGSCSAPNATLTGKGCYCEVNKKAVFGRIQ